MPIDPSIALQFRLPQQETPFQTMGQVMTLRNQMLAGETAELERQRRIAFENEVRNLPEDQRTTENLVKIASKYAPAKDLYQEGQRSLDRDAQRKATLEMATARLQQAATQADRMYQLKIDSAKDAQEKAYWQQERDKKRLEIEAERVRQGASRLFYDTGEDRRQQVPSAATASPIFAPAQQPISTTMGYGDAMTSFGGRPSGSPPLNVNLTPEDPGPVMQGVPAARQQQAEAPQQLVQPTPNNLDARDLRAQQGQGVPVVRAAAEAEMSSQMPPEIQKMYDEARSPKQKDKIKAQWEAGVIKAEIERVKATSGANASEDVVKAIAEGRMKMPEGWALKSAYWQNVIERVAKLDPKFDASKYAARAAARRTFASGPEARNVTALNTVIGHLGTLDEAAQALNNNNIRMANSVFNRMATEIGDPRVQNFDTAKQAVAEETMRVFRQVGASEREAREWGERITSSGSPAQLRGVINTLGQLLESRVEAIAQQYERTVNEGGNPSRIDPKNRKLLDQLKKPLDEKSKVDSILDKYK